MIIVGELINASRKSVREAIESRDEEAIKKLARDQRNAGADYIDVNAGVFVDQEADYLKWLVQVVQEEVDCPCCLDSPDPEALKAALKVHKGTPLINSISLEKDRWEKLLPLVAESGLKVVALCMADDGMPETTDQRMAIADKLINRLVGNNVPIVNIFVDPLVQPVSTNSSFGIAFLETIQRIMAGYHGVHTICGLSNISYGLPERKFLNQTFVTMAIDRGLDGTIINPLDQRIMANIVAAEALAGRDEYCVRYLQAYRAQKLEF